MIKKIRKATKRRRLKKRKPVVTLYDKIVISLADAARRISDEIDESELSELNTIILTSAEAYMDVETAELWNKMGDEIKIVMINESINSQS